MTQAYFFNRAAWVGAKEREPEGFSVLRGHFAVDTVKRVTLNILGLGFFKCYVNGVCINPDTFLPLSSDFEASCDPAEEVLSGHRVYVPQFDITPYVKCGDNVIAVQYGGGWYTHRERVYGLPKVIYRISVETENGTAEFVSDESCRIAKGFVDGYCFVRYEEQSFERFPVCFDTDFDDSAWENAVSVEPLETEYCVTDCPADTLIEERPVTKVCDTACGAVYDCGENTTGYPVLKLLAGKGEKVEVFFSEELTEDGEIDRSHAHGQRYAVIADGTERLAQPEFTWYGFRYFEVAGAAQPQCVKVIHADVPVNSTFACDNETLNWMYETFLHTMHCNMHTGHPSDCPHIERRGYTGDGQLTCNAVLTTMDAQRFYTKWLQDIADSQDTLSGHIQYTAPYIRSGGGPGGWGCAIVEVPYQMYKHYGDKTVLEKYYGNMRRYIDYLEAHSDFGLVTSDKAGEWCLGDWCGPNILYPDKGITSHNQQVMIPAAMVNTYFMVKSLKQMAEIAQIIGRTEDIPEYEEKIALRKKAIQGAYFNTFDGNFVMNVQGANAYAVDLGLGTDETYENLVRYYSMLGYFDTGIFATDILIRVLFERGDSDLAVDLLENNGEQGFAHWRANGATTFHEYWDSNRSRSHNHPMFGAPVAYLFRYLLGIGQAEGTAGYTSLVIAPQAVHRFRWMRGSMTTPEGICAIQYKREADGVHFAVTVPENTAAVFRYNGEETVLKTGENLFVI